MQARRHLARLALVALSLFVRSSDAAASGLPEDAAWEGFVGPAVAREGMGAAEYHGKLVLWGDIAAAAHQAAGGVVLWDGTSFEALPPVPAVKAITIWNDRITVATRQDNLSPTWFLSFDGTAWDTLGTTTGSVSGMTVFEGRLVAVGLFTAINGVSVSRVAAFDGVGWSGFGSGLPASSNPKCVHEHAGTLVVGGAMSSLLNIARWNAVTGTWQTLGAGLDNFVSAMVSDGTNLFASGGFTKSGTTTVGNVARWDGVTWNPVCPKGPEPSTMALWNGNVVFPKATGVARLAVWDGVGLTTLPGDSIAYNRANMPSNSGSVGSVGTWGTKLVVTGNFYRNGSVLVPGILLYDGAQWSTIGEPWDAAMSGPGPGDVTDMRAWGGQLIVAGMFGLVADLDHFDEDPGIAAWDGTHWSALGSGLGGTQIWLGEYQGDLIAAGWLTAVRPTGSIQKVARWNGTTWSAIGTGAPDFATSIQQFRTDLFIGSTDIPGIFRWNGSTWSAVPGAEQGTSVFALGTTTDSLVAGGQFDGSTGMPSPNVAFWDGTAWRAAGAGVNSFVYATTTWNGRVVIGGQFTASGAAPLPGVAIWDGASWQPLGSNVEEVERLRVIQGELYASGDFKLPDGSTVETVARYVGPDWELLGSGSNNYIFEAYGTDLYQAGTGLVHGQVAHSLARRPLPAVLDVPRPGARAVRLSASPNPCGSLVHLAFSLPAGGRVRLSVLDVTGRQVARLVDGVMEAGPHELRWSAPSRAGVYFAVLDAPGRTRQTQRIVRLR